MILCAVAMAMVLAQTPTSVVAEPTTITGTLALTGSETTAMRTAGGNTFITMHNTWNVAGDLAGTYDCIPRAIMFSTGQAFVAEWGLYTVTWGDYEGTIRVRNVGEAVGNMLFHMDTTIVGGGTGDFAELRGYGTLDLNFNEGTAVYSLEVFWGE